MRIEDKMLEEIFNEVCEAQIRTDPIYHPNLVSHRILSIIARYCVIEEEGEWPSLWNGKEELKSALTYKTDIYEAGWRKVRKVNDHS